MGGVYDASQAKPSKRAGGGARTAAASKDKAKLKRKRSRSFASSLFRAIDLFRLLPRRSIVFACVARRYLCRQSYKLRHTPAHRRVTIAPLDHGVFVATLDAGVV